MLENFLYSLSILLFAAVVKAQNGGGSAVVQAEVWCVARNDAEDTALQSALAWACGPGGADCGPVQAGGPCYDPADIQQTASYAFNDYYLKHGMSDDACRFDNNAAITSLNPSHGSCKIPSSKKASNGNIVGTTTKPFGMRSENADSSGSRCVSAVRSRPLIVSIICNFFVILRLIFR